MKRTIDLSQTALIHPNKFAHELQYPDPNESPHIGDYLGKVRRALAKKYGKIYGQKSIAKAFGYKSMKTISDFERGRPLPKLEVAVRMADIYGISRKTTLLLLSKYEHFLIEEKILSLEKIS